ncbi:uncharacterized [Tachysurus ichikawai]
MLFEEPSSADVEPLPSGSRTVSPSQGLLQALIMVKCGKPVSLRLLAGHFLEPLDTESALVIRSTWMPSMSGEPAKEQRRPALGQHR